MRIHRAGFTLLEMMLSVTIMLLVFGIVIPFFQSQVGVMSAHAGRFDAQQNARFGAGTIDRELRIAGEGVPNQQPMIVQASPYAVTFNADLATYDSSSTLSTFGAVYYDPDLSASATTSLPNTSKITLPLSAVVYPDSNYYNQSGPLSYAETISFWVALDTTAGSNGRYALYRRVNNLTPTIVSKGLVIRAGDPPPFTYMVYDTLGQQVAIPQTRLPIYHVAMHGSTTDIGNSALTDSIRLVRVHLVGSYYGTKADTAYRTIDLGVRIMNAGLLNLSTCGNPPIFGQAVTATYSATVPKKIVVTWSPALDETGGEKDVERYVVYRRTATATVFGEPYTSIPAGNATYSFSDLQVASGDNWVYGVAAQDCGGQFSPVTTSAAVTVP
jgi:prepilin-type N-terminal cleavage/methylation domain-containing protein